MIQQYIKADYLWLFFFLQKMETTIKNVYFLPLCLYCHRSESVNYATIGLNYVRHSLTKYRIFVQ